MSELRFDGRVAIVTGAGGVPSLGRSYALLLAERGAKVVVNDLGTGPDGRGIQLAHADRVAEEIQDAGGEAVADTHSVAGEESASAVVQTALDTWGRVDVLVNNAGVAIPATFSEMASEEIQRTVDVHLMGTIWMCRAAWPHMRDAGYGRIVNISSRGLLGGFPLAVYGAAKGGIVALMRSLAIEGDAAGIRANAVNPSATTIAALHNSPANNPPDYGLPERVAPMVAFLAHEECTLSGRLFVASGRGHFSELVYVETAGYDAAEPTLEDVRDNLEQIADQTGAVAKLDPVTMMATAPPAFDPKPYAPA